MGYLRGFIPWIVAASSHPSTGAGAAISGLASGLLLLLQDRHHGVGLDALILEISTIVYFAVVGAMAIARPDSALADHTDVVSFAWRAEQTATTGPLLRPAASSGPGRCCVRLPRLRGRGRARTRRGL